MGFFAFKGNNAIFEDLVSQLPNGTVYFKEKNIIPAVDVVTYIEQFNEEYEGKNVNIYINDRFYETKKVLAPHYSIYSKLKPPPYGKFMIRTEVNNEKYKEEVYYSLNIFTFLNALAIEFNYDYTQIFFMFQNIWHKYLQDEQLYNDIGWFYNFNKPFGWNINDYRKILIGSPNNIQINHLFLNSMTYWSLKELVKSFTGVYPEIYSYRNENGWIIPETKNYATSSEDISDYWEWKEFYLLDYPIKSNDVAGVNLSGKTLNLTVQGTTNTVTFSTTTGASDISSQINSVFSGFTSWTTEGSKEYVLFNYGEIKKGFIVNGGTAISDLGFEIGEIGNITEDLDVITLYDERYYANKIDLIIKQGSKEIESAKTRGTGNYDFLAHKNVINTVSNPVTISGYTETIDFDLVEQPSGSNKWAIHWLNPTVDVIGTNDGSAGFTVNGKTFKLNINNEIETITFQGSDPISIADVVSQINNRFIGTPASIHTVGSNEYVKIEGYAIKIIDGTAVSELGFNKGQQVGVPLEGEQYIVIYSYFIKEQIIPLCEKIKPAFIKINYFFEESV